VVAAVGFSVALGALISYLAISKTIMNRMDGQLEQRATVFTAWPRRRAAERLAARRPGARRGARRLTRLTLCQRR
jgi:hypothetical protein